MNTVSIINVRIKKRESLSCVTIPSSAEVWIRISRIRRWPFRWFCKPRVVCEITPLMDTGLVLVGPRGRWGRCISFSFHKLEKES